jgi:hypothetical protein
MDAELAFEGGDAGAGLVAVAAAPVVGKKDTAALMEELELALPLAVLGSVHVVVRVAWLTKYLVGAEGVSTTTPLAIRIVDRVIVIVVVIAVVIVIVIVIFIVSVSIIVIVIIVDVAISSSSSS